MKDSERCPFLDNTGCRCLLRASHRGPHDPSYTTWVEVLELRAHRRLAAIRDGAVKARGPE